MTKCEIINIIKPYVKIKTGKLWSMEKSKLVKIYKKVISCTKLS